MVGTVAIVSPGAMGSALGRAWAAGGVRVVTTVAGRSARTRELAGGLEWLPSLADVVAAADLVVSVGPPASAVDMATEIATAIAAGSNRPVVLDVNAVAPATVHLVAAEVAAIGCELLDGSISGPPPGRGTSTVLYLSGPGAAAVAAIPAPGLRSRVVGTEVGLASAVKMSTAAVYKGFTAVLLQSLQAAHVNGVLDEVVADLSSEFGAQVGQAAALLALAASKSDRFPGEMREIALTQAGAGGQPALYEAMAVVYEAVGRTALAGHSPEAAAGRGDLAAVLGELGRPRRQLD